MKTIGMLGGMSWESTALYYRMINEETRRVLGGLHSARIAMVSVDFHEIETLQHVDDWNACARLLVEEARGIEAAGADFLMICTNTMHRVAPEIEEALGIPLLHIADATAERVKVAGMKKIGLLGTRFTMEMDFYKGRLESRGIEVLVPPEKDRAIVHQVIYDELCRGQVIDASRQEFLRIIDDLAERGAEGVIEGCTEIVMLVEPRHTDVPLFDTTSIHAEEAVAEALGIPHDHGTVEAAVAAGTVDGATGDGDLSQEYPGAPLHGPVVTRRLWQATAAAVALVLASALAYAAQVDYVPSLLMFVAALIVMGVLMTAEDLLLSKYDTPHKEDAHPPQLIALRAGRSIILLAMAIAAVAMLI